MQILFIKKNTEVNNMWKNLEIETKLKVVLGIAITNTMLTLALTAFMFSIAFSSAVLLILTLVFAAMALGMGAFTIRVYRNDSKAKAAMPQEENAVDMIVEEANKED